MSPITEQDVYDREAKAISDYMAAKELHSQALKNDDFSFEVDYIQAFCEAHSWQSVADLVRAGGDPLICVMERE